MFTDELKNFVYQLTEEEFENLRKSASEWSKKFYHDFAIATIQDIKNQIKKKAAGKNIAVLDNGKHKMGGLIECSVYYKIESSEYSNFVSDCRQRCPKSDLESILNFTPVKGSAWTDVLVLFQRKLRTEKIKSGIFGVKKKHVFLDIADKEQVVRFFLDIKELAAKEGIKVKFEYFNIVPEDAHEMCEKRKCGFYQWQFTLDNPEMDKFDRLMAPYEFWTNGAKLDYQESKAVYRYSVEF